MQYIILAPEFAVCKIKDIKEVDFSRAFVFLSKTNEEISLVCEADCVPAGVISIEKGWRAFRVAGVLDFGLVGIIAKITAVLAEAGISVFVVSTFDTDYVLLKSQDFDRGLGLLTNS